MTDLPPLRPDDPVPAHADRREGSVTLRGAQSPGAAEAAMTDPANRSLADALRIMLFLLQGAMVVLAGLYVLSGVQSVQEGNRGIRLLFGRVESTGIDPGFAWSAPYPFGELVKVDQGNKVITIDKDFWFYVAEGADTSPDKNSPTASLKPGQGGSVLTADGNIAHMQWRVVYRREQAADFAQNVLPEHEEKLVLAAAKRGIVQAAARVTIDDLLTQSGESDSVRAYAKQVAQETLDAIKSGIRIEQLDSLQTVPPLWVRADFARVQGAVSQSRKIIEDAQTAARSQLFEVAGRAAPYLIQQLNLYENAAARQTAAQGAGDSAAVARAEAEMNSVLAVVDAIMQGQRVELPGGEVEAAGKRETLERGFVESLAGGQVVDIIATATSQRTMSVNRGKTELARFQAKLAQYEANPRVMLYREWAGSVGAFLARDSVQQLLLPIDTTTLAIQLNIDPTIQRDMERAQKQREADEATRKRMELLRKEQFVTPTGRTEVGG